MRRRVRHKFINGVKYTIRYVPASKMPSDDPEEVLYGYCDPEKTTIYILDSLSSEAERGALNHEVGHGSSEESGARQIMEQFTPQYMKLEEHLCRVWLPVFLESLTRRK